MSRLQLLLQLLLMKLTKAAKRETIMARAISSSCYINISLS